MIELEAKDWQNKFEEMGFLVETIMQGNIKSYALIITMKPPQNETFRYIINTNEQAMWFLIGYRSNEAQIANRKDGK